MCHHTIKAKGSRFFVFNEDYYNASGGMFDCELITDDFDEAERLAIKLSNNEYFPESVALFDLQEKEYYVYVNGRQQHNNDNLIKFI